jgi:DNA-directed RNA polymerase specialized sigma24 family protein
LRFYDDRDYAEIAAIVGCSEMSARANVSQAIRRLRDAIKERK